MTSLFVFLLIVSTIFVESDAGLNREGIQASNIEKQSNFQVEGKQNQMIEKKNSNNNVASVEPYSINISDSRTQLLLIVLLTSIVFFGFLIHHVIIRKEYLKRRVIDEKTKPKIVNKVSASLLNSAELVIEDETATRFLQKISTDPSTLGELFHQDDRIWEYNEDKWECPIENLIICGDLGEGNFGVVMNARVRNIFGDGKITRVAAKTIAENSFLNARALAIELMIFANLGQHPNIVSFLGACTRNVRHESLWIIFERCRFGNLYDYIKKHESRFTNTIEIVICGEKDLFPRMIVEGPVYELNDDGNEEEEVFPRYVQEIARIRKMTTPFSTGDLLTWSSQVAHGMEFLSKQQFLHGDLTIHNVLLSDNRTAKICDLCRGRPIPKSIGYYHKMMNEDVPLSNSAIEVIEERKFSTKSDVWAFGVFVWELLTLGGIPYIDIIGEISECSFLDFFKQGDRLEKPRFATERTYRMMLHCWEKEPNDRPSFSELIKELKDIMDERLTVDNSI